MVIPSTDHISPTIIGIREEGSTGDKGSRGNRGIRWNKGDKGSRGNSVMLEFWEEIELNAFLNILEEIVDCRLGTEDCRLETD